MSKTLIIDPGHGGKDPGAICGGIKEKEWNLEMSLYQYKRLKQLGANVALTRQTDVGLSNEVRVSKIKNKYDYCMSNHFNSVANFETRGVEAIHSIFSDGVLAWEITSAICSTSGLPFRRLITRKNTNGKDWYYMQRLTGNTETVTVEYGFLSNAKDRAYYKNDNNFYKVAESVVKVWCNKLGVVYKPLTTTGDVLYSVQVGAFNNKDNAEKLATRLNTAGFETYIITK